MKPTKPRNIFVIDTSVLVYDSAAFRSFKDSFVIIPIVVLEELDKVKKEPNESGRNARVAVRYLDEISSQGNVVIGIDIDGGSTLFIDAEDASHVGSDSSYGDNKILGCALRAQKAQIDSEVVLVSRDINLRVRAKAMGVSAIDYTEDRDKSEELYSGVQRIVDEELGSSLLSYGELSLEETSLVDTLYPNECVIFTTTSGQVISVGRKIKDYIKLVREKEAWGLQARSPEQKLAIDMIMDPKLPLVSLTGLAGGGKTLISIASALELVLTQRKYETFSIYRPIQSMGQELGYLPGSADEKLSPWFAAVDDAFQMLLSGPRSRNKESWKAKLFQYITDGTIQKEALSYIRGRSIPNSLILVDEAQNLSKHEIKTIITRVGLGSKIILVGDPSQIDAPKLDATSNGLSYLVEKFQRSSLAGHITFSKGERSQLATEASLLL